MAEVHTMCILIPLRHPPQVYVYQSDKRSHLWFSCYLIKKFWAYTQPVVDPVLLGYMPALLQYK